MWCVGRQVWAGEQHQMALSASGEVLAWGVDEYGQLGLGKRSAIGEATPRVVGALRGKKIIQLGCGTYANVVESSIQLL